MNWIGQSLLRKEDQRFLTGTGNFVSDIADRMPGVAHLVVLRSPHACARINAIDTEKAARLGEVLKLLGICRRCILRGDSSSTGFSL